MSPAPQRRLSRSERRAANRKAIRGREPSLMVRSLAAIGRLTRSNTKPGTVGRQAADAAVYRQRVAGRPEGVTARERAGHEPPAFRGATAMSALLEGPPRFEVWEALTRAERVRIARYNAELSNLATGELSAATFRRRIRGWAPIRGERFLSDPAAALAILEERRQAGDETFIYEGRRQ